MDGVECSREGELELFGVVLHAPELPPFRLQVDDPLGAWVLDSIGKRVQEDVHVYHRLHCQQPELQGQHVDAPRVLAHFLAAVPVGEESGEYPLGLRQIFVESGLGVLL